MEEMLNEFSENEFSVVNEWEKLKESNESFENVFEELQRQAVAEFYVLPEDLKINDVTIRDLLLPGIDYNSDVAKYLIEKLGYMSIYNRRLAYSEDGLALKTMNVDNVEYCKAIIIINLLAIISYENNSNLTFGVKFIFENEDCKKDLDEMIQKLFPQVVRNLETIILEVKEENEAEEENSQENIDLEEVISTINNDDSKVDLMSFIKKDDNE